MIAPFGTGFAAAVAATVQVGPAATARRVFLNEMPGSSFNPALALQVGAPGTEQWNPRAASGGALTWEDDTLTPTPLPPAIWYGRLDPVTGLLPSAGSISQAQRGSAHDVKLVPGAPGEALAIWSQEERGARAAYMAPRTASGFGEPTLACARATSVSAAWNGTDYLVACADPAFQQDPWLQPVPGIDAFLWNATQGRRSAGNPILSGASPAVASNGTGFLLAWVQPDGQLSMLLSMGDGWMPPPSTLPRPAPRRTSSPRGLPWATR